MKKFVKRTASLLVTTLIVQSAPITVIHAAETNQNAKPQLSVSNPDLTLVSNPIGKLSSYKNLLKEAGKTDDTIKTQALLAIEQINRDPESLDEAKRSEVISLIAQIRSKDPSFPLYEPGKKNSTAFLKPLSKEVASTAGALYAEESKKQSEEKAAEKIRQQEKERAEKAAKEKAEREQAKTAAEMDSDPVDLPLEGQEKPEDKKPAAKEPVVLTPEKPAETAPAASPKPETKPAQESFADETQESENPSFAEDSTEAEEGGMDQPEMMEEVGEDDYSSQVGTAAVEMEELPDALLDSDFGASESSDAQTKVVVTPASTPAAETNETSQSQEPSASNADSAASSDTGLLNSDLPSIMDDAEDDSSSDVSSETPEIQQPIEPALPSDTRDESSEEADTKPNEPEEMPSVPPGDMTIVDITDNNVEEMPDTFTGTVNKPDSPSNSAPSVSNPGSSNVSTPFTETGPSTYAAQSITVRKLTTTVNRKLKVSGLGIINLLPDYTNNRAWKKSASPYNTPFLWGQCTWFAWARFYEMYGFSPEFYGNGYDCVSQLLDAHSDKFKLSKKPAAGAVFSSDVAHNHVGIVLDYDEKRDLLTIQEGNLDGISNSNWEEAIQDYRTIRLTSKDMQVLYGNVTYAVPRSETKFKDYDESMDTKKADTDQENESDKDEKTVEVRSLRSISFDRLKDKVFITDQAVKTDPQKSQPERDEPEIMTESE